MVFLLQQKEQWKIYKAVNNQLAYRHLLMMMATQFTNDGATINLEQHYGYRSRRYIR